MGFLDLLKRTDINEGVKEFKNTENAVLLDVRTPEEVLEQRIPESINIPLDRLTDITLKIPDKQTKIFVHCHSGSRSSQAVGMLKKMGYTDVTNIGGIMNYNGKKERG